jgi:hypothetical protein
MPQAAGHDRRLTATLILCCLAQSAPGSPSPLAHR